MKSPEAPVQQLNLNVSPDVLERWKRAADRARVPIATWVARRVDGRRGVRFAEPPEAVEARRALREAMLHVIEARLSPAQLRRAAGLADEDLAVLSRWLLGAPAVQKHIVAVRLASPAA